MVRLYTTHFSRNKDQDKLLVITVYEPGTKEEQIKRENCYTKKHGKVVI